MTRNGKWAGRIAGLAAAAAIGFTAMAPVAAHADGWHFRDGYRQQNALQQNKNTMRNVAIGSAALGILGLADHNNGLAILGAAGAAIAGSQYERDRHQQSVDQSWRDQRWDWNHGY